LTFGYPLIGIEVTEKFNVENISFHALLTKHCSTSEILYILTFVAYVKIFTSKVSDIILSVFDSHILCSQSKQLNPMFENLDCSYTFLLCKVM